jgi:O-antigen ligase
MLWILVIGMLGASLYLAPAITGLALAVTGLGLPLLLLVWWRPEMGLLAVVFLAASLIPVDTVDLRLPIGGLELRDLAFIGVLGILILRELTHKTLSVPWWPVGAPLLVFLGLALISTLYALLFHHVASNWVFSDLRTLSFYGVFFVAGWAVRDRAPRTIVLVGLFILADVVVGVVILQQFLGAGHPLLAAMSEGNWQLYELQTAGTGGFGMVRLMPPGVVLVYFAMITAFCLIAFMARRPHLRAILGLQFLYLSFGLLLTYTRALWISTVFALMLVLIILSQTHKAHVMRYLRLGIPVLLLLLAVLGTGAAQQIGSLPLISAFVARVRSMSASADVIESSSLQWRLFEIEEGLRSVSENPLLGVGLGNSYRGITTLLGEANGWRTDRSLAAGEISRLTRFLHNSYLYIAVKMGLPGLASFLWFYIALVVRSRQLYQRLSEGQSRAVALGVFAGSVGLMPWSVFHQHFVQVESTAIVGLMAGLAAGLYQNPEIQKGLQLESGGVSARSRS